MDNKVKILIVEDEFIVAEDIRINLTKLDYEVTAIARTGTDAIAEFEKNLPDMVLMDIRLKDDTDGIATAGVLRNISNVPLIYLTAHSDKATFERARKTEPHAYIIKPFNFQNLHMAIELAFDNFSKNSFEHPDEAFDKSPDNYVPSSEYLFNDAVFIKFGKAFQKIRLNEICFIKADGSYCVIRTPTKDYTLSMNLHTLLDRLQRPEFMRVHRSYVVNLECIDRIEDGGLHINEQFIPVSKSLRETLLSRLNSL